MVKSWQLFDSPRTRNPHARAMCLAHAHKHCTCTQIKISQAKRINRTTSAARAHTLTSILVSSPDPTLSILYYADFSKFIGKMDK